MARMQSPIALFTGSAGSHTAHASTSYHHMSSITVADAGFSVRAVAEPGGVLDLSGVQYTLDEVHCHSPAEHTIDDYRADLEAHLVHSSAEGRLAVLAVLFDVIDESQPVDAYINLNSGAPSVHHLSHIVPHGSKAFRYTGSRTVQPYTKGVEWVVYVDRLEVGRDALESFRNRYGGSNRELQDGSGVVVTLG